jgi:DNA-binding PadR family transcriptional regulator
MRDPGTSRGTLLVLLALKAGAKHGYEIASYLERESDGIFTVSYGALYPILHALEKDKLVSARWAPVGNSTTKRKKIYTLTTKGQRTLEGGRADHRIQTLAFARLLGNKA